MFLGVPTAWTVTLGKQIYECKFVLVCFAFLIYLLTELFGISGTPSAQTVSVSAKVGTPVSLTGQRFTVQIPSSQAAVKSGKTRAARISSVLGGKLIYSNNVGKINLRETESSLCSGQ